MTRLVVVSNRVAPIHEGQTAAGGLAVAVLAALRDHGGVWFGWNGEVTATVPLKPDIHRVDQLTTATIGLTRRDYTEYYTGFSNSTLWPLFHYRIDLAGFDRRNYAGYMRVNQRFAKHLFPMLRFEDMIWVHDYHLIPLGDELRRMGTRQPIGFFLHTPFPALQILRALPRHRALVRAMCAYDLVGFQTSDDLAAFRDYVTLEAGGRVDDDGVVHCFGRTLRAEAFPIGIDTANVAATARRHDHAELAARLRTSLGERKLIIGVDRLDYSKGLVERFTAFERLLEIFPDEHRGVVLMQIAPPSRGDVHGYTEIRQALETAAGHINGRFADFDWLPIRYLNKSFNRDELTCFLRHADIGLVTPLRDGMNLVAKEYVAAQDERDPGVLVLSRFAGAARELDAALIVNPHDPDEVAAALRQGLEMRLAERRNRWRSMMTLLEVNDVDAWRNAFVSALESTAALAREG
jgi:trehalose 6-phosphate synthase